VVLRGFFIVFFVLAYFEGLLDSKGNGKKGDEMEVEGQVQKSLSPIEQLFHKHMKRSLSAYEDYYQKLARKNEKEKVRTKAEYAAKMAKAQEGKGEGLKDI